ncbi:hypothetical protein LJC46_04325 [Desulfovibrio sp. OttesenSCG-928-G15]|nr:hypothetical protein [Desulfovibrio sp. OttesenSCG-928-G15]
MSGSYEEYQRGEAEASLRHDLYLDDLRVVLSQPAGVRVLRHWLDATGAFSPLCGRDAEATVKAAAVADYGKFRMYEIVTASPEAFVHIMRAGVAYSAQMQAEAAKESENG